MRNRISALAAVVFVLTVGAACSGGSAQRGASASTTTPSPGPSSSTPSPAAPAPAPLECAAKAPLSVPRHQRAGTTRTLVPGQPIALLACRYHGFNQPQPIGTLARAATSLSTAKIANELDAIPKPTSPVVANCPIDFGEKYLLYFSYPDGPPLLVSFDNGGCHDVTNGDLTVPFAPTQLTLVLEAALGQDRL